MPNPKRLLDALYGAKEGGAVHMQDGGDPTQMFNFNPMAAKAAKQKQMRESTPETPLGALSRGFASGLFGNIEDPVPYTGSIMEGSPQRQQSQANLREIGRNVGALTDIGGMVTPFAKPAVQAVTRGATALGRTGLEQVDRAMFGEGPLASLVAPVAPLQAVPRVQAPVSRLGFYDPVEQAGLNIQRKQGPGQAFLNELQRSENVSKDFLEASGIAEKLRTAPNITRDEVQAMTKGAVPEVEELVLGDIKGMALGKEQKIASQLVSSIDSSPRSHINLTGMQGPVFSDEALYYLQDGTVTPDQFPEGLQQLARDYINAHKTAQETKNIPTKWDRDDLMLPGGSNYREVLLKVPSTRPSLKNMSREEYNRAIEEADRLGLKDYTHQHWGSTPNVVAHIRMNDRTDYNGNRVLFIEEMQSDWAQQGRKKGFGQEVPEGPFVKSTNEWVDLSLKNIIKRAVDEGYDRVAFINGKQSADRYDLANYVDNITWNNKPQNEIYEKYFPEHKSVVINTQNGNPIKLFVTREGIVKSSFDKQFDDKKLDDVVGKDIARKIMAGESGSLEGEGLSIGGKGMKDFYDKIVPDRLRKLIGKDKVKNIPGAVKNAVPDPYIKYYEGDNKFNVYDDRSGELLNYFDTLDEAETYIAKLEKTHPALPQLGFDITPEIREKFSKPIPYKKGGAVRISDNPDTMLLELMNAPKMQAGGKPPPGIKRATERAKESKSVLPVAGARQARQAIQGYLGMDPSFSVMDPEAQALESAYRGGETASVLGDLFASLTPFGAASAAAKANQVPGLAELIAYHGSPHKFKKFDASKIGTGEGAQAYGHGLYFAENPAVAKDYRKELATEVTIDGKPYFTGGRKVSSTGDKTIDDFLTWHVGDVAKAIEAAKRMGFDEYIPKLEALKDRVKRVQGGALYTVDIPDEKIAQMLDWDKPLSQQPAAMQVARKVFNDPQRKSAGFPSITDEEIGNLTGQDLYRAMTTTRGGLQPGASKSLLQEGIPGIQYLDQASRDAKQGTRNFVVFPGEEQNIKMLDINGEPQMAKGGKVRISDNPDTMLLELLRKKHA